MKAPDKIYIDPNYPYEPYGETQEDLDDIVYICKDSLLSKLTERMEQAKVEAGGCSNMHAAGKYISYQEMIDLIKEL